MKEGTKLIYKELLERYPQLGVCGASIMAAYDKLVETVKSGNMVFCCGNGGSAADSEHIVGELLKCFKKKRPINKEIFDNLAEYGDNGEQLRNTLEGSIRAISLTSHLALSTAFANDRAPACVFAQQLYGLGQKGDTLIAISTSGNSQNCVYAAVVAKAMEIKTVALTGQKHGKLTDLCDCSINVPECETFKIQELHLPIYHALCAMLEEELF